LFDEPLRGGQAKTRGASSDDHDEATDIVLN
jgi:hypothetical protein